MHLKRFREQTLKDALRAVREELGPDALVLSTREVSASGVRGWFGGSLIEVTAAVERPGRPEQRPAERPANRPASDAAREIVARLEAVGLDTRIAREVAASCPVGGRRSVSAEGLQAQVAGQLASLTAAGDGYAPVEVFVGPPGVGKTTTIAKIAAQERAKHGTRLGLVAADGFRVGAVEQLRMFADIIGSRLSVARSPSELADALAGARGPVLLDTAGRSPKDDMSQDMFRVLADRRDVRTHLVLAASTPVAAARRIMDRFGDIRPERVVLTRLDEAESVAPLMGLLRDKELPLSYFGTGQKVPEDLQRATPAALAAWVMGGGAAAEMYA